jgi:hypothetical protein
MPLIPRLGLGVATGVLALWLVAVVIARPGRVKAPAQPAAPAASAATTRPDGHGADSA